MGQIKVRAEKKKELPFLLGADADDDDEEFHSEADDDDNDLHHTGADDGKFMQFYITGQIKVRAEEKTDLHFSNLSY